jgi:hypothetical protein
MRKYICIIAILAGAIAGISNLGQALASSEKKDILYPRDQLCPPYDPQCLYGMDNQEDIGR